MDLDRIKQIIELMKEAELTEFDCEEEGFKLRLKRGRDEAAGPAYPMAMPQMPSPAPAPPPASAPAAADEAEAGFDFIRSPMVGTFYRAPSPESPPYIELRDRVKADTVVCIVEAMKVMNEIQSEVTGSVVEILVENGETVEYGQPLFKVKTD